jgi:hypothetical protein
VVDGIDWSSIVTSEEFKQDAQQKKAKPNLQLR